MKKYMEYCEIVCQPRRYNAIDPRSLGILQECERPYVVL